MVGGGGATSGTVVENGIFRQRLGQLQHIGEAGSDALGSMRQFRYRQVASTDKRFAPVLRNENTFRAVNVETDGYGICWGENLCIECGKLYAAGKRVPLSMEEFKCFVRERVVDSAEAAEELTCSKQNVDDLAKRGKLHPIKEGAKYRLFLKSEVMQRKWK